MPSQLSEDIHMEQLQGFIKESQLSVPKRQKIGRWATRAATVAASTATIFAGITITQAETNTDRQAQAASPFDSMNGAEKAWCRWPSRWALCQRTSELADQAANAAADLTNNPVTLHNGLPDAFRHCYWSGLMTKEFGWETAKDFGDRHEYNEDQHPMEAETDLYNNRQGRIWAQEVEDIGRRCLQGMESNELKFLVPYNAI